MCVVEQLPRQGKSRLVKRVVVPCLFISSIYYVQLIFIKYWKYHQKALIFLLNFFACTAMFFEAFICIFLFLHHFESIFRCVGSCLLSFLDYGIRYKWLYLLQKGQRRQRLWYVRYEHFEQNRSQFGALRYTRRDRLVVRNSVIYFD